MGLLKIVLLVLALLPVLALGDDPLTPLYDAICNEVECGKGKCVPNIAYPLGYRCECDPGWTRTSDDDVNQNLQYLPCVIPNCTLNYNGCQAAPAPVPDKPIPSNISVYDPCYWMYCGGGTCTRNTTYTHLCTCQSGFTNLLDIPYFPCYSQCTLGSDCASLGIKVSKSQSPTSTSGSDSAANPANSILPGNFQWMIILLVTTLMTLHK